MLTIKKSAYTEEELTVLAMLFQQMDREVCNYSDNPECNCDSCKLHNLCRAVHSASRYADKIAGLQ